MKMITLIKEYPLRSRCDAGCSRCVYIHSYTHTHTHTPVLGALGGVLGATRVNSGEASWLVWPAGDSWVVTPYSTANSSTTATSLVLGK